jgi:hypothetical protein
MSLRIDLFGRVAVSLWFLAATGAHVDAQTPAYASDEVIELCDFNVPRLVSQGNMSFSVVYSAVVGDDGRLTSIAKVKNDFLKDEPFDTCLSKWKLPRGSGKLAVVFNWQHATGWRDVSITGKSIRRWIKFHPGWQGR